MTNFTDIQCLLQLAATITLAGVSRGMAAVQTHNAAKDVVKKALQLKEWDDLEAPEFGKAKAALSRKIALLGTSCLTKEELGVVAKNVFDKGELTTQAWLKGALRKCAPMTVRRSTLEQLQAITQKAGAAETFFREALTEKTKVAIEAIPIEAVEAEMKAAAKAAEKDEKKKAAAKAAEKDEKKEKKDGKTTAEA